jgi:hypothetical protein
MEIKKWARVRMTCAGSSTTGTVELCAPVATGKSLGILMDGVLKTKRGELYAVFLPLLKKNDGLFHELVGDEVVDVAVT